MKSRFSTVDIIVIIQELKRFLGMRVVNVYDIDNKTYLIRVGRPDEKCVILIESGIRLHSTEFDWPKNPAPSGFSMKLRKHLKGRRFENITQLGIDRIVDLQFGSGEAAYHVILELYDRGNIVLTDYEYIILNILRPRTDNSQDVRFAVKEKYPIEGGKTHTTPSEQRIRELMERGKNGDVLKKFLVPNLDYGPAIIEHALLCAGFSENVKFGSGFTMETDFSKLMFGITEAESLLDKFITQPCKGYIIQKKDKKTNTGAGEAEEIVLYEEFHPFLFNQHSGKSFVEYEFFNKAVDEFFSKQESQKLDMKVIQHERNAFKKLDNVKKDHEKRIHGLQKEQESDILRGQLIEMNLELVDKAILIVRSAVANQIDWTEIWSLVKEAQLNGDPVACTIKNLKLDTNQITVLLHDPYPGADDESEYEAIKPMKVDLDLTLSAYGNSRKYFDKKKLAAKKEQKTVEASNKAFKSAEKKTKQSLKEVQTAVTINKTRKTYWFEKFLWFISSENYLVIGGRDQQQNELIVKRYMKTGDLYVHADLHGASSCVIKNPGGGTVPPKTLNEAGTMAICNSAAWDSKVVTSAWWVYHDQVSKTAPSGEYLTTGSFMIRVDDEYRALETRFTREGKGRRPDITPPPLVNKVLVQLWDIMLHRGYEQKKVVEWFEYLYGGNKVNGTDRLRHVMATTYDRARELEPQGRKNYLPPSYLIYGFGFLFKLEEGSIERHQGERRVRVAEEEDAMSIASYSVSSVAESEDIELDIKDDSSDEEQECGGTEQVNNENLSSQSGEIHNDVENDEEEPGEEIPLDQNDLEARKLDDGVEDISVKTEQLRFQTSEEAIQTSTKASDLEFEFPDTNISLHHVKGDKYELHREFYSDNTTDSSVIYLGDSVPVTFGEKVSAKTSRISAKQRREMKKKKIGIAAKEDDDDDEEEEEKVSLPDRNEKVSTKAAVYEEKVEEKSTVAPAVVPTKRGQKSKKKRIKEKYGDQDEEERNLRMEILASAGEPKSKNKKGKDAPQGKLKQNPKDLRPKSGEGRGQSQGISEIKERKIPVVGLSQTEGGEIIEPQPTEGSSEKKQTLRQDPESDGEKEDDNTGADDLAILNSLTGIPVIDDELLYAIPVCAPYNAILNYKHKVKLMPGNTKKGKAMKTALGVFIHDKSATNRERDLLKIQKDVDLARNVPGKVKVAAPNMHKGKR